jgi:ankyrin repeat protein
LPACISLKKPFWGFVAHEIQKAATMSQDDIDAFITSASLYAVLTPQGVVTAVLERGIPVNGRSSSSGCSALHWAVCNQSRELVVALLEMGADANVKDNHGWTSVWWAAYTSTAEILQLLLDGGGSVNEPNNDGETPLIALVSSSEGDAAGLGVLLARPELDLDVTYEGKTAEQWAEEEGYSDYAAAIAATAAKRHGARWDGLRSTWIAASLRLYR